MATARKILIGEPLFSPPEHGTWETGDTLVDPDGNPITGVSDHKIFVSGTDLVPGYLLDKLIAGGNISITQNNVGGTETITIAASPRGYSTIQDEGSNLQQRSTLNFIGAGVQASDAAPNTKVTIFEATPTQSGTINLTGDLGNVATSPQVLKLRGKAIGNLAGIIDKNILAWDNASSSFLPVALPPTVNLPGNPADNGRIALASGGNLIYGSASSNVVLNSSSRVSGATVSDALDNLHKLLPIVFPTITDVVNFDFTGIADGTLLTVITPDEIYEVVTSPSASMLSNTNGVDVIQPTTPSGIRLVRKGLRYAFVSDWYVATTGSDVTGDGSSGSPFATVEHLQNVICPKGERLVIRQNTTIHLGAGAFGTFIPNIAAPVGSGFTFTIQGTFTSTANMTINGVVNTVESAATPVEGRITVASGSFTDKERIRVTSGTATGCIAYSTGLTSSTDTFVTTWAKPLGIGLGVSYFSVPNGSNVAVDTLQTSLTRLQIHTAGNPITGVIVADMVLLNGVDCLNTVGGSGSFIFTGCKFGGGTSACRISGNIQVQACRFVGPQITVFFGLSVVVATGCVFEVETAAFIVDLQLFQSNTFNGGWLDVAASSVSTSSGGGGASLQNVCFVNGTAAATAGAVAAIFMGGGGKLYVSGQLYGFNRSGVYPVGVLQRSGSRASCTSASNIGIPATQQLQLAGNNKNYADIPTVFINDLVGFVLDSNAGGQLVFQSVPSGAPATGAVMYFDPGDGNVKIWKAGAGSPTTIA